MNEKLSTKDLINVGIYTALYLVLAFMVGMLSAIPMLYPTLYFLWPLTTGIPFMLFLTKVNKFGMISLMAIISGLFWFSMGYTWTGIVGCSTCGIISDLIFKSGKYKNFKSNVVGYWVYSLSIISLQMPLWIKGTEYVAGIREMMGDKYTDQLLQYMPPWIGIVAIGIILIGAISGSFLGKKMLKKHFKKAGIA